MKTLYLTVALALHSQLVSAEALSDADREALLERLENIQKEADSKVDSRFRLAISAYNSAMGSNDAAIDLYLKCEEKVNFEDMKKKSSDFRDWKRKNAEMLSDASFRLALRQQLRWLVLTLQAASEDADREVLAVEAAKIIDSIFSQADGLVDHRKTLEMSVISTVFARAYDIKGIEVKDWPMSPTQLDAVYDQVILPPLRRSDRISSLSAMWTKRMIHEGVRVKEWIGTSDDKKRDGEESPAYEIFIEDTLPNLRWQAEVDLFKAGDERAAAMRMLKHIDENISHKAAPKWASDFSALLQGEAAGTEGATEGDAQPKG